ncbi:conserved hypothetical protein [Frankia sp. Hr75.2]|nr:conserved hypothetical protein [Frankia sp. Hr75.2]
MRPQDRPRPVPTRPVSATSWPAARRGRVTGTDLLTRFATGAAPVDAFGIGVDALPAHTGLAPDRLATYDDVSQAAMHEQFARRRVYVHLPRRASLGLSLLEATHLGMPVVALAVTRPTRRYRPATGRCPPTRAHRERGTRLRRGPAARPRPRSEGPPGRARPVRPQPLPAGLGCPARRRRHGPLTDRPAPTASSRASSTRRLSRPGRLSRRTGYETLDNAATTPGATRNTLVKCIREVSDPRSFSQIPWLRQVEKRDPSR